MQPAPIREIAIARWWNGADLSEPLPLVDGGRVSIIFRGTWSHGLGPDFSGALLDFGDGRIVRGNVEIHLRTSAWRQHGHHLDARYDEVALHLVMQHDGAETRRCDGRLVPVAIITPPATVLDALEEPNVDWSLVGGDICAAAVVETDPASVRSALWHLGDERLGAKVALASQRLAHQRPADVLFGSILEGLGYAANREPMRRLADLLPTEAIDARLAIVDTDDRRHLALALLLGTGGFLPLSPSEAALIRLAPFEVEKIETLWRVHGGPWHGERLDPLEWQRTRVRPANHPVRRLAMAAALVATTAEGILGSIVAEARATGHLVEFLGRYSRYGDHPRIGSDRAIAIVASGILPFLLAYADAIDDPHLAEVAASLWASLDASAPTHVTRRAEQQVSGPLRIGRLGERGMQGLIQLDRAYCQPRRCLECPIARLVFARQTTTASPALE